MSRILTQIKPFLILYRSSTLEGIRTIKLNLCTTNTTASSERSISVCDDDSIISFHLMAELPSTMYPTMNAVESSAAAIPMHVELSDESEYENTGWHPPGSSSTNKGYTDDKNSSENDRLVGWIIFVIFVPSLVLFICLIVCSIYACYYRDRDQAGDDPCFVKVHCIEDGKTSHHSMDTQSNRLPRDRAKSHCAIKKKPKVKNVGIVDPAMYLYKTSSNNTESFGSNVYSSNQLRSNKSSGLTGIHSAKNVGAVDPAMYLCKSSPNKTESSGVHNHSSKQPRSKRPGLTNDIHNDSYYSVISVPCRDANKGSRHSTKRNKTKRSKSKHAVRRNTRSVEILFSI